MAQDTQKITINEVEWLLETRIGKKEIELISSWASQNEGNRERLFSLAFSNDERRGSNAMWCITHLSKDNHEWIQSKQNFLIDELLTERKTSRKRMILQLLREQLFFSDDIRVDFLDFCLSAINSESESYAVRCFSLYVSIKICRHYPELLSELEERISLLAREPLSPGLRCAVRKVSAEIKKTKEMYRDWE